MNQMPPIAEIRMPKRIPKNPTVATLVVGLPHCEVTTTKETIARRMPMPIVIRTGFHETFSEAGAGSIYVPSSDRRGRNPPPTDAESVMIPCYELAGSGATRCVLRVNASVAPHLQSLGFLEQARNPHEYHGSDESNNDRSNHSPAVPDSKYPKDPTADDAPQNAENNVDQHGPGRGPDWLRSPHGVIRTNRAQR